MAGADKRDRGYIVSAEDTLGCGRLGMQSTARCSKGRNKDYGLLIVIRLLEIGNALMWEYPKEGTKRRSHMPDIVAEYPSV